MNYEQLLNEQEMVLNKITELTDSMKWYTVTTQSLRELEEHVMTLGQLEKDMELVLFLEDEEERNTEERARYLEMMHYLEQNSPAQDEQAGPICSMT